MDNWFNSKWFIRAISLVFAITLYAFVTVETDTTPKDSDVFTGPKTEIQVLDEVPVDVRIDSEKYVVSGVPETVTVSLEGKASFLTSAIMQRNFNIYVDLLDLEEGEHTVDIEHENMPREINAYLEPQTIKVTIEERATAEFPIEVDFVNSAQFPVGYELGEVTVSPEKVKVTSSRAIIDQIAMVKVFLDVNGLVEPVKNRVLPVNVYDGQGNDLNVRLDSETTSVSVEVDRPSKTVPIKLPTKGKLPNGLELKSIKPVDSEIEIYGTRDALATVKEALTEVIDFSKIEGSGKINVKLDLPNNLVADTEEIEVDVILKEG